MENRTVFLEKVAELQDEIRALDPGVDQPGRVSATAARLSALNYAPPVPLPVGSFLVMTRRDLQEEIARTIKLSDAEVRSMASTGCSDGLDIRLRHISVLVYYFKQLAELRLDVPEAWDDVDEVYVHD